MEWYAPPSVRQEPPARQNPSALTRKLGQFMALSPCAVAALEALQVASREVPARTELVVQGRAHRHLSVLVRGAAIRYKLLPDGRRQIINFVVPGDFIGLHGCVFATASNSVMTLQKTVVAPFSCKAIVEIGQRSPMLAGIIFWLSSLEQTMLSERLVTLGRCSAYERLAYLFCELLERLQWAGLADERSFTFPLSQELLADALGLSTVHVNRTLTRLRRDGLVIIEGRTVTLPDPQALAMIANLEEGHLARCRPAAAALTQPPSPRSESAE